MWGLTPLDQLWCRIEFRKLRYEGHFTPPTLTGTLQFPGNAGGFNWGSVAVDEENLLMVVNPLIMSNRLQLYPRDQIPEGLRVSAQEGTPYAMTTRPFMSPLFVPCQKPPYGTLGVVDLKTRTVVWNKPVGTTNESGPFGLGIKLSLPMGTANRWHDRHERRPHLHRRHDGSLFRAFDLRTGELWHDFLPATAQATPMSYLAPRRTGGW
jgi:glucose dehydrogenase